MRNSLKLAAVVALCCWPAAAKPVPSMLQSRYNAQLEVQNFQELPAKIDGICRECDGQITNFNSDLNSGSGNLNVRVPEAKLSRCVESLRGLGVVRNENRSVSDNTSSYQDAMRNLSLYEKALATQWSPQGNLSAAERGMVDAEFKSFLRDRVNSYRSSINSYEQNRGYAEISVSLSGPQRPSIPPEQVRRPRHGPPVEFEPINPPPPPPLADPQVLGMALFAPALLMLGLLSVYLFKVSRAQRRESPPRE